MSSHSGFNGSLRPDSGLKWPIRLFFYVFLAGVTFFLHNEHSINSDEGFVLSGAWDLLNGRILYTDLFSYIPPGSYYLLYWAWSLFSPDYYVAKLAAIIFLFFSAIGIQKISELFQSKKRSVVPPLLFIFATLYWPIINHHVFSLTFIVWGIFFFFKAIKHSKVIDCVLSGCVLGISSLFLLHKGIFVGAVLFVSLLFVYLKQRNSKVFISLTAFFLSFIMPIIVVAFRWPLDKLFYNLIVFPSRQYLQVNTGLSNYYLFAGMFFATLIAHAVLSKKRASLDVHCLAIIQYSLLLISLQLPDYYHVTAMIFPLYILFGLAHSNITSSEWRYVIYPVSIAVIMTIFYNGYSNRDFWRGRISMFKEHAAIKDIQSQCQKDGFLYTGPFLPGLYFETRLQNATKHSMFLTNFNTQDQMEDILKDLQRVKPDCVLVDYSMVEKYNYDINNLIDQYIGRNYFPVRGYGNAKLLRPKGWSFRR